MNAQNPPLFQRLFGLLQQRETALRALLEADGARALQSTAGETEVPDFKHIAAQGALAVVEDIQVAHAAVELENVMAAQRRLDDGNYGFCADCGEPIAEQRLLAMPQASYCMACQTQHESPVGRLGPGLCN